MAKYVGLDWAGKGWFSVVLRDDPDDEDEYETEVFPTILSVWHKHSDAERIFVDIPIGLPEGGRRRCDEIAADKLGPDRRSSVFWTPCRDAVYATTLEDAKEINRKNTDYSISNQTWAIMPRIREVDEFLQEVEEARDPVREVHPEVCFWAFEGAAMANGKKTETASRSDERSCRQSTSEPTKSTSEQSRSTSMARSRTPAHSRRTRETT